MKKFVLFAGIAVCLGLGAREARAASANAMVVKFHLTVLFQSEGVTVTKGSSTNNSVGLTKVKFGDQDMLKLLASEFDTTFPPGAQLAMNLDFGSFAVLDKAGNVLKDLSSNPDDSSYVFNITNNSGTITYGKSTETAKSLTQNLNALQPDYVIAYADGKGNQFHFGGLATIHANIVSTTEGTTIKRATLMIPNCSGQGAFLNPNDQEYDHAVFTGFWGVSGANLTEDGGV